MMAFLLFSDPSASSCVSTAPAARKPPYLPSVPCTQTTNMTTPTTSPPITTPPGTAPALTTTFTPSPACVVNIYRFNATDSSGREQKQFFDHLGPIYSTSTCLPSGWTAGSSAFFSPGVYCPVGYEVACTSEISLGGETETRGTCCPRYVQTRMTY